MLTVWCKIVYNSYGGGTGGCVTVSVVDGERYRVWTQIATVECAGRNGLLAHNAAIVCTTLENIIRHNIDCSHIIEIGGKRFANHRWRNIVYNSYGGGTGGCVAVAIVNGERHGVRTNVGASEGIWRNGDLVHHTAIVRATLVKVGWNDGGCACCVQKGSVGFANHRGRDIVHHRHGGLTATEVAVSVAAFEDYGIGPDIAAIERVGQNRSEIHRATIVCPALVYIIWVRLRVPCALR